MSTIIRWNPLREMATMQNAMDRLFEDAWRNMEPNGARNVLALDVHDTDANYIITANLPGVDADNIDITLHNDVLTISAEVQKTEVAEGVRPLVQERVYGKFIRSLNLAQPVNVEAIETTFENGVLTLTLPKSEEAQPRRIQVKRHGLLQNQN